jgi:hypothetical protein
MRLLQCGDGVPCLLLRRWHHTQLAVTQSVGRGVFSARHCLHACTGSAYSSIQIPPCVRVFHIPVAALCLHKGGAVLVCCPPDFIGRSWGPCPALVRLHAAGV